MEKLLPALTGSTSQIPENAPIPIAEALCITTSRARGVAEPQLEKLTILRAASANQTEAKH
jgi:hypothetical protein